METGGLHDGGFRGVQSVRDGGKRRAYVSHRIGAYPRGFEYGVYEHNRRGLAVGAGDRNLFRTAERGRKFQFAYDLFAL